jgi:outer membrane autotransporter protein
MPAQHTYRPQRLALAIALAMGCAEFAIAQQSTVELPPPTDKTPKAQIVDLDTFLKASDTFSQTIKKATDGSTLQLDDRNDLIVMGTRGSITGLLDGGGGENALQLDAAKGGRLGDTRQFQRLDVKQGSWTLTGEGDFSTGALVRQKATLTNAGRIAGDAWVQGTLNNKGEIDGRVEVFEKALFSGNGSVGALDVKGHMLVNRLQGAPKVKGDMNLANSAVLTYGINPDGPGETIKVGGTARLGGATLEIVAALGEHPQTSQHTIIEANKVEGTFATIISDLAFLKPVPEYGEKSVGLTYVRNEVPINVLAPDENGRQFADSIEDLAANPTEKSSSNTSNAAVTALLGSTTDIAPWIIELLAGDSNANLAKTTLNSVSPVSSSMLSAMHQLDSASDIGNQNNAPRVVSDSNDNGRVWVQALGYGGKLDRNVQDLKYSTEGLVLGADWAIDEQWRLGVIGGKASTRMDSRELEGELDSWHLGAYGLHQSGRGALRLGVIHSQHDGSNKREVAFYGFSDRPKGRYDANTQQAFAQVGYNLGRANVSFEPFASLGYQRYQRDSFTEKGGAAALKVHGQTNQNFSSTFGLRLAQINGLENGMQLTPRFSVGWKHTYGEIYNDTRLRLVDGGKDFTVYGAPLDRDTLMLDAGLELRASANHTLGVGVTGEAGSDSRSYGVMGQWRMAF